MSIIYDALQKTQRNREYLRMQSGFVKKKSYRQHYIALGLTAGVVTLITAAYWSTLYFKPQPGSLKMQPAIKEQAQAAPQHHLQQRPSRAQLQPQPQPQPQQPQTPQPQTQPLESAHLWVTENQNKTTPMVTVDPQTSPELAANPVVSQQEPAPYLNKLTLNGVLISDSDKTALINNQAFHIGDMIDGMRIVTIDPTRVRLQSGSDLLELRVPV